MGLEERRSPPQQYMRLGGQFARSFALAFGMMRGSQAMPLASASLGGIFDSSRTTLEGTPCCTFRK
jgi:hypothetical protein